MLGNYRQIGEILSFAPKRTVSHSEIPLAALQNHNYEVHAYEVYPYEMHACKMHAYEVHTRELHAHETHAYEIHAREMRARKVHACVRGARLYMYGMTLEGQSWRSLAGGSQTFEGKKKQGDESILFTPCRKLLSATRMASTKLAK
jgi:hypothetical protein